MTDLYFILGLTREATHADIRQAYRSLSLLCHPDIEGGDAAQFERVKEAHDILTDEESRKFYDETGQIKSRPVEGAADAAFYGFITQFMMQALSQIKDVEREDITTVMNKMMAENERQTVMQIKSMTAVKTRLESVQARLTRKAPSAKTDMLAQLLSGQITAVDNALKQHNDNIAIHARAREFMAEYDYKREHPPESNFLRNDRYFRFDHPA